MKKAFSLLLCCLLISGCLPALARESTADSSDMIINRLGITLYWQLKTMNQSTAPALPQPAGEGWDVLDLTAYPLQGSRAFTFSRKEALLGSLLLVNQWHSRPVDFDDEEMVAIYAHAMDSGVKSFWDNSTCKLNPDAIDAMISLLRDAGELGYDSYVIQKGYSFRTWEEQYQLFNAEFERQRKSRPNLSEDQLVARARKNVSFPGTSEYNSGLSFRLYLYSNKSTEAKKYYTKTPFYDTPDGQWLLENAWKYGFVFRFPTQGYPTAATVDKSYKTGMNQSLNCYRYVGKAHAAVMHHLDLCLEEYIEYLMDHPHIAVYEDGVKRYEIIRYEVGDAETFTLEGLTGAYSVSLDNLGGAVVAYEY